MQKKQVEFTVVATVKYEEEKDWKSIVREMRKSLKEAAMSDKRVRVNKVENKQEA